MTKAYIMNSLCEKMMSPDQDFRYMGLSDLVNEIKQDPNSFLGDEAIENKVIKQVMKLIEDKISEVKNQAVKALGQLIKILGENQMIYVVDQLIMFVSGKDDELRDISGLALKTITSELPPDGKTGLKACEKLTPRLLQQLASPSTPPDTLIETLMALSILIARFPGFLASVDLQPAPLTVLAPLLGHTRPAVHKRAISTLAQFIPVTPPVLFQELLTRDVLPGIASGSSERQQTMVQLVAAVARHSALRIAPVLEEIVPSILKAVKKEEEELRESCLQTLEALVLRCPTEVTPFLSSIIQTGVVYIKYDPNYAGDDADEDEEMADADDDDDDAELDEYEDEEDTSYKIRRSSTKLLSAVISTRPELLSSLYREVSPVLISRFGDREETVKLEVWATYGVLLKQTRIYGSFPQSKNGELTGTKRKRENEGMEVDEAPHVLLRGQVPILSKALLNQMKSQRAQPGALQAGFDLLSSLLQVLPGSLSAQTSLIASIAKQVLTPAPTTATSSLYLAALAFLRPFFGTHAPPTFASVLPTLTPPLIKVLGERHPRIASEAFRASSSLLIATNPVRAGSDWAESVYDEALKRLQNHDTDAEVRAAAEEAIGNLWVCAPDVVRAKSRKEWDAICRTTGRIEGAVKVVTKVAREADIGDDWVNNSVEWVITLLKKGGRTGKPEAFVCLEALLRKYEKGIPADLPPSLVPQLKQFVTTSDTALLAHTLTVLSLLLTLAPAVSFQEVERDVLQDAYNVTASPLVTGSGLEALLAFYGSLVEADDQIATHIVPSLIITLDRAPAGQRSPANVAKSLAQVVKSQPSVAAGTIAEFSKHVRPGSKAKSSQAALSLLVIGELGRFIDMSTQPDLFNIAINHFTAEEEEVRSAAAFAAGNIAIGNLHQFLPPIVKLVQEGSTKRLLALHAVKETVTHASHGQLELVADSLWAPLFENSATSEESARNVAAACLGRLTTTHPSRYLPQLQARIHDENPAARATVVSAIRYTFADTASSYDEVLAPLIVEFMSVMADQDLTVRRLALSTLNSAARTKPHLIRDHLPSILPNLYQETVLKPELIRKVQMGPWTQVFDDGLEARKTAYETMYTLLDTCLQRLDLHEFLSRVMQGLADDSNEIKVISHMMLFRLAQLAPTAVTQRLDEATPLLEKTMKGAQVTKDTVKQDIERAAELQRSTLRATAALSKVSQEGAAPKFDKLVSDLKKDPTWGNEFKDLLGV